MSIEAGNIGPAEIELPQKENQYVAVSSDTVLEGNRQSADLTWVNLNFNINGKNILTNCWGKVGSIQIVLLYSLPLFTVHPTSKPYVQ